jgi:hypothetical protein
MKTLWRPAGPRWTDLFTGSAVEDALLGRHISVQLHGRIAIANIRPRAAAAGALRLGAAATYGHGKDDEEQIGVAVHLRAPPTAE